VLKAQFKPFARPLTNISTSNTALASMQVASNRSDSSSCGCTQAPVSCNADLFEESGSSITSHGQLAGKVCEQSFSGAAFAVPRPPQGVAPLRFLRTHPAPSHPVSEMSGVPRAESKRLVELALVEKREHDVGSGNKVVLAGCVGPAVLQALRRGSSSAAAIVAKSAATHEPAITPKNTSITTASQNVGYRMLPDPVLCGREFVPRRPLQSVLDSRRALTAADSALNGATNAWPLRCYN